MDTTRLITDALAKSGRPAGAPVKRYSYQFDSGSDFKSRPDNSIAPEILRRFSITHEVSRICINARKRQISQLDWDITPLRATSSTSVGTTKGQYDSQIELVKQFFKHLGGYKTRFRSLQDSIIEDLLVLDTVSIYKEVDSAGRLLWLKQVDAATMKVVVDEWGNTPEPPNIAYRQYIRGQLQAEFTAEQMIWDMMNPRSTTPYGLAPLESLILVVSSALRASLFNLDYLTYQNIPEGLLEMPEGWSRTMIDEWQDAWDAFVAGSGEANSKLRVVPTGTKYSATKKPDDMGFEVFNWWLMQITCAMFDIQPHEIGFTDTANKATAKEQDDVTLRRGIQPLAQMLKEIFDDVIQVDLGFSDLQFTYLGLEDDDTLLDAQSDQINLATGMMSIDEVRIARGLEPIGIETPYILAGTGPVWITSGVVQNELEDSDNHYELPADAGDDEPIDDTDSTDGTGDPKAGSQDAGDGTSVDDSGGGEMSATRTITDLTKMLIDDPVSKELRAFRTFAITRLKKGNWRDYHSDLIHPVIMAELNVKAAKATTTKEIDRLTHVASHLTKDTKHGGANKVLNSLMALTGFSAIKKAFKAGLSHQMNAAAEKLKGMNAVPPSPTKFAEANVPPLVKSVDPDAIADWNRVVFNTSVNSFYTTVGSDTTFDLTSNAYKQKLADESNNLLQKSSLDDTTKKLVSDIITSGASNGDNPATIAKAITDQVDDISDYRASMIATTETNSMMNDAQLAAMGKMGVTTKSWVPYGDNPCVLCEGNADASPIPVDQPFPSGDDAPDAHPWCVLPGQEIEAARIDTKMTTQYDGDAIKLTFASGKTLSVTPNHLVATRSGWVAAAEVQHGVDVLSTDTLVEKMAATIDPNIQPIKTLIEDVSITGDVVLHSVPSSSVDFHGDEASCQDVDIIFADRKLGDHINPNIVEGRAKRRLRWRDIGRRSLIGLSAFKKLYLGSLATSEGVMSDNPPGNALLFSHGLPAQQLNIGIGTDSDSSLLKAFSHGFAGNTSQWSKFLDRFASFITFDKVVDVERFSYHGLVYNLTVPYNFYTVNSIITHNCQCALDTDTTGADTSNLWDGS